MEPSSSARAAPCPAQLTRQISTPLVERPAARSSSLRRSELSAPSRRDCRPRGPRASLISLAVKPVAASKVVASKARSRSWSVKPKTGRRAGDAPAPGQRGGAGARWDWRAAGRGFMGRWSSGQSSVGSGQWAVRDRRGRGQDQCTNSPLTADDRPGLTPKAGSRRWGWREWRHGGSLGG